MGRIGETETYQSSIESVILEDDGITEMDWCEGTITLYSKVDIHGYVYVRERKRESRFLTTHQHILGYTVSFTLYMIFTRWTADNLK